MARFRYEFNDPALARGHFGYAFAMIQKNEKMGGRPFFENVEMRAAKEITGLVETPDGKPAAGVKVLAYSNTDKQDGFEYGSFAQSAMHEALHSLPPLDPAAIELAGTVAQRRNGDHGRLWRDDRRARRG